MSKDPNYVVKIEQAIAKQYGEETIQNPKKTWTEEKDEEYFSQLKELYKNQKQEEDYDKKEVMVFSYQKNYLIVILIVPVPFVSLILQKHKTISTLQSLIVALNVISNG